MHANKLSGSLKAAILIHAMGRPVASRLLNRLTREEVGLVNQHLEQMGAISPEVVEQVAKEFTNLAQRVKQKLNQMKSSTDKTQPQHQTPGASGSELSGLKAILSLSADEIFDLVKDEHPQTISIILIHLDTAVASDVISKLPDEIKADVAVRVTSLDKVNEGNFKKQKNGRFQCIRRRRPAGRNVESGRRNLK
jgi:flagellar motor switch protein FliG